MLKEQADLRSIEAEENQHYGFQLLKALKYECTQFGFDWYDAGNVSEENKALIKEKLDAQLPVIIALNGPKFSDSGRGCIKTLVSYSGELFRYADPNTGDFQCATWKQLVKATSHPDGNFIFIPEKITKGMFIEGLTPFPSAKLALPVGPDGSLYKAN